MSGDKKNIIIYNTVDGKASVSLYARDGMVWMNQNQIAELFDTSKQNIGQHIANILKEGELEEISVVKNYLTTAADVTGGIIQNVQIIYIKSGAGLSGLICCDMLRLPGRANRVLGNERVRGKNR